jgi:hypothetical protein
MTTTAAPVFVTLTRSTTRRVARIRTAWAQDYLREGPGGLGFAYGSFDQTRPGTARVAYTDGTTEQVQVHSEMEPEEWLQVGQYVTRTTDLCRPVMADDGIPW